MLVVRPNHSNQEFESGNFVSKGLQCDLFKNFTLAELLEDTPHVQEKANEGMDIEGYDSSLLLPRPRRDQSGDHILTPCTAVML